MTDRPDHRSVRADERTRRAQVELGQHPHRVAVAASCSDHDLRPQAFGQTQRCQVAGAYAAIAVEQRAVHIDRDEPGKHLFQPRRYSVPKDSHRAPAIGGAIDFRHSCAVAEVGGVGSEADQRLGRRLGELDGDQVCGRMFQNSYLALQAANLVSGGRCLEVHSNAAEAEDSSGLGGRRRVGRRPSPLRLRGLRAGLDATACPSGQSESQQSAGWA
jgi:hypothetical protein